MLLDDNRRQIDGATVGVCNPFDFEGKSATFEWTAFRTNGPDTKGLYETIQKAKAVQGKLVVIICETIKGYRCLSAERAPLNHYMNVD